MIKKFILTIFSIIISTNIVNAKIDVVYPTSKELKVTSSSVYFSGNTDYGSKFYINDEAVIYVNYDEDTQNPINEVLSKNDVQYGNENSPDIQTQPYIIIKQRLPLINVEEMAKAEGVSQADEALAQIEELTE